jgi:hypothetical protein
MVGSGEKMESTLESVVFTDCPPAPDEREA